MTIEKLQANFITNAELIKKYLTPHMKKYFFKKLKNENHNYIKIKICELLKFFCMSHHAYGDIPFNDEIDELWHLWILQTIQYQELIHKLPTGKFINHSSNDYIDESLIQNASDEEKINNQISYLVSYVANFGQFNTETVRFWPMANRLMEIKNINLEKLNEYLLSFIN